MLYSVLPPAFIANLQTIEGLDVAALAQEITSLNPPISVRYNPEKLSTIPPMAKPVPWCNQGFYLHERPNFTVDPLFHAGNYYVQEASSMFVAHIWHNLEIEKDVPVVLDLCAAPGGKSTHLLSLLSGKGLLVANEVNKSRHSILQANINRWGLNQVVITASDARSFGSLHQFFDVILLDAPCSGEGLFRKDIDAIKEWSPQNVALCANRQKKIVNDILPALKSKGYLIYSTCTYEPAENEENVAYFSDKYGLELVNDRIQIPDTWNIEKSSYGFRFYPHKLDGEGFFISVLKNTQVQNSFAANKVTTFFHKTSGVEQAKFFKYLTSSLEVTLYASKAYTSGIEKCYSHLVDALLPRVFVTQIGTPIGKWVQNELIPEHALALSTHITSKYAGLPLPMEGAYRFLKKEDISSFVTEDHYKNGWYVVSYAGHKLGWVKKINQRFNNYYPKEMRILRDFMVQ